ncbi:MAG: aminotransferase class V-fold PLP-dependent enzyme [Oligoflexus sp.]
MTHELGRNVDLRIDPSQGAMSQYRSQHMQALSIQAQKASTALPSDTNAKLQFLREQKLGRLTLIDVPDFWKLLDQEMPGVPVRPLLHLDYTASAQALSFMENYLQDCLRTYANTHTETSDTGRRSTQRFQKALIIIKKHVHAPAKSFVLATGYGATGAIERIQKILGLYMSPRGQKIIAEQTGLNLKAEMAKKYVVFVGPAEHHSNDVSWQDDALCHFVRIKAVKSGPDINEVDLDDLEAQLKRFPEHIKIGSFSAASNVTGMKYNLQAIGAVLSRHDAFFLVDYAASGPYEEINMTRDGIDAIFLSTHKNLGGTNLGLLVATERLYDLHSNPSFGGGGTVTAVTPWEYHFHSEIEHREFPGTPAIRQVWQAALSFQMKEWLGHETIERVDQHLCQSMMSFFQQHARLEVLGNPDPKRRHPIYSFLIRHGDQYLHHTFIAALLNDLFGIQARSGCACAGPFGHELLNIEKELSDKYVLVIQRVLNGFKPGWTRIGTHYTLDDTELQYLQTALSGIAWFGALFLDQYEFNPYSGDWRHLTSHSIDEEGFDFQEALDLGSRKASKLPQLTDEGQLHQAFHNQLEEFILLTAFKIASLIVSKTQVKLSQQQLESLALSLCEPIRQQIQDPKAEELLFCQKIADKVCPIIKSLRTVESDCEKEVVQQINSLLFRPQEQPGLFQQFSGILEDVRFFYVWQGRMNPPIQAEDEATLLQSSLAMEGICRPCEIK